MDHHEDPAAAPAAAPVSPVDRAFAAIVRALTAEDPRFVRRVTAPAPGGLGVGNLMIIVGFLATVLFGVLPLAVGLGSGLTVLFLVGGFGCTVLPVAAPLVVRGVIRRVRPMAG